MPHSILVRTRGILPNFYPFLAYVIVTTFTPGPNNVMAMSNAMRFGFKKAMSFVWGVFIGFWVILTLSGLLNMMLANYIPGVRAWLNILGAIYMLYLAYHIALSKPVEDGAVDGLSTFKAGFFQQFVNIKVLVFGITVFSLFIVNHYQNPITICLFAFGLAVVGFLASSSWAVGGNLFRSLLKNHYRLFNYTMAGLLVYTAIASFK
jgi:cysteine/O-acetylserine efflux protein